MTIDPLPPPDASSDLLTRPMTKWLRLALACGLLPLLAGTFLYVGWRRTEAVGYEVGGTLLLLFGGILFFSGWMALWVHILSNPASTPQQRRRLWIPSAVAAVLLALQVPLLIVFVSDVKASRDRYEIVIENASGRDLDELRIDTPRGYHRFAPLRDGTTVHHRFQPTPRGEIRYAYVLEGAHFEGLLDASPHAGGRTTLRIPVDLSPLLLR